MKRWLIGSAVLVFSVLILFQGTGECGQGGNNFYELLSGAGEVKVYIAGVTDSSGQAQGMTDGIKKALENALASRQTINFKPVENEADADMTITCDVTERIWLAEDPIDEVYSAAAAAMDALTKENYGRLQAVIKVQKGGKTEIIKPLMKLARRGNIFWEAKVQATITKAIMPEEESKPLLEERLADVFIKECFSKKSQVLE